MASVRPGTYAFSNGKSTMPTSNGTAPCIVARMAFLGSHEMSQSAATTYSLIRSWA